MKTSTRPTWSMNRCCVRRRSYDARHRITEAKPSMRRKGSHHTWSHSRSIYLECSVRHIVAMEEVEELLHDWEASSAWPALDLDQTGFILKVWFLKIYFETLISVDLFWNIEFWRFIVKHWFFRLYFYIVTKFILKGLVCKALTFEDLPVSGLSVVMTTHTLQPDELLDDLPDLT